MLARLPEGARLLLCGRMKAATTISKSTATTHSARKGRRRLILRASLAALLSVHAAQATSLTWDNGAATGGWNTTDLNWTGAAWSNATPDDAIFGATGVGTVSLTEAITAGRVTINSAGYIIDTATFGLTLNSGITANESATIQSGAGGSILLGANNAWSVAATKSLGVSSVISGTGFGLTKTGDGTLTLSGVNTYDGGTVVNAGTLALAGSGTFGAASGLLTVDGGTAIVNLGGTTQTVGAVTLKNGAQINSGTLIGASYAVESGSVSAMLAGAGGLIKTTGGTVTLSGANTYSGATTIGAGILNANATAALGNSSGTNTLIFTGGTLQASGTITSVAARTVTLTSSGLIDTNGFGISIAGIMSGAGGLTKSGLGTLTFSAANTYDGVTNVNEGVLTVSNATALGTTAGNTVVASGGEVFTGTTGLTVAEAFNIAGTGTTGAIHIGGNATLIFSGAITLSADARIQGDGGTTSTFSGGIDLGSNILTFNGSGNTTVNTNAISGVGGSIVKNTGGTLTLSGTNTFTGGVVLNAGTLAAATDANLGGAGGGITFNGSATFTPGSVIRTSCHGQ